MVKARVGAAPRGGKRVDAARKDLVQETISIAEMSNLINLNPRNVRDLAARGILVPAGKAGRYETVASLHNYIQDLRDKAAGRATKSGINLSDERALLAREQRIEQERKNRVASGEIITLSEAKDGWSRIAIAFRSAVSGLPSRIRAKIPHLTPHDGQQLAQLCRDTLEMVADELQSGGPVPGSRGAEWEMKDEPSPP